MAVKIPGKTAGFVLSVIAVLTVVFPILSLPCSITGLFQARIARKFLQKNSLSADNLVSVAYYLNLFAIIATAAIILLALPGAIERNLN